VIRYAPYPLKLFADHSRVETPRRDFALPIAPALLILTDSENGSINRLRVQSVLAHQNIAQRKTQ